MNSAPRVTNLDVAKLAKVSVATVSYVLNNKGAVGENTRQRVLKAMQDLGYQPNPHAARLRRSATLDHAATGNVGLVWTNKPMGRQVHADNLINQGVSRTLEKQGCHALITFGEEDRIFSPSYLAKVDAIILAGTPHQEFIEKFMQRMPVVSTNSLVEDLPLPTVTVDDRHVGRLVTNYLIGLGHTRIGYVSHTELHPFFNLRQQGYQEVMLSARLWDERLMRVGVKQSGMEAPENLDLDELLTPWLSLPKEAQPTAIFAANDELARAVYQFASRAGIRIPHDWSVVGCDDDPGICLSLDPTLTTVQLPFAQVGERAAEIVMRILAGSRDDIGSATFLRGQIVERNSTRSLIEDLEAVA